MLMNKTYFFEIDINVKNGKIKFQKRKKNKQYICSNFFLNMHDAVTRVNPFICVINEIMYKIPCVATVYLSGKCKTNTSGIYHIPFIISSNFCLFNLSNISPSFLNKVLFYLCYEKCDLGYYWINCSKAHEHPYFGPNCAESCSVKNIYVMWCSDAKTVSTMTSM